MDELTMPAHVSWQDGKLICHGQWTTRGIGSLAKHAKAVPKCESLTVDGADLTHLDSGGAWLLLELIRQASGKNKVIWQGFKPEFSAMLEFIAARHIEDIKPERKQSFTERLGRVLLGSYREAVDFLDLMGRLFINIGLAIKNPRRLQINSIANIIDSGGIRALPIVGMLTFLIGVVLAYQLGVQLSSYGANIFVVYLSTTAIFREFGPLITAIIVAGRTSSAFTAQIGMMKVNQEIDAMLTMGLSPVDRLVLPRIIGMLIAFPFLIFWADMLGAMGSMMMAKVHLDIGYMSFLQAFKQSVSSSNFWIGVSKAPIFAMIVATVGCYQGFEVSMSADSVGKRTTQSVVVAIFLIILADAGFSIIYSLLGI